MQTTLMLAVCLPTYPAQMPKALLRPPAKSLAPIIEELRHRTSRHVDSGSRHGQHCSHRRGDPGRVIARSHDILHSYAAVVRFRLPHGGQDYDARGLTSVFTFPTSRQKGYGSQVVAAATEAILSSGADLGLLLTHAGLHRFYARSGWEAITSAPTLGPAKEQAQEIHAYRMMLFLSAMGQAGRRAFETEPLYIELGWGV